MSLYIAPRPTQGADKIKFTTIFLEAATLAGLQVLIDALPPEVGVMDTNPQSFSWLADIQYQTIGVNPNFMYSVMIVTGEWNP